MKIEFAEWLINADASHGDAEEAATLMDGYSGRGMYGNETCAVTTGDVMGLLLSAIKEAAENPDGVPAEKPVYLRTDSLGTNQIVY